MADPRCKTCGGPMVRKSRARLLIVGLFMAVAPAVAAFVPILWAPAIISALTGLYLIAWAAFGKGYWCRECKRFSVLRPGGLA